MLNLRDVNVERMVDLLQSVGKWYNIDDEWGIIGSEESALDYAFMFSALESCDINHLSPETYLRKLILGLHEKKVEKKQLLPCYIGL